MLTYRAVFNALAGFADHAARIIVGFVVTPILVTSLGSAVFGIWQIIFRLYSQLTPLDGRSAELLKWQLANLQDSDDTEHKKQMVGAAILGFLSYLPLLITCYIGCIYAWNYLFADSVSMNSDVKYALIILMFNTVLIAISLHFEAVIRGANLFYKITGLKPIILIISGVVTVLAIHAGYGLIGAAMGQLAIGVLSVPFLYVAAKRLQPWLGVKQSLPGEYKLVVKRCKWFVMWEFLSVWMIAGEVLILGWLLSSEYVSVYTLTMYAMQMLSIVVLTTVSSAMPGMGGLIGRGELARVSNIRKESLLYSLILSVSVCAVIIVFNESFIGLWVGDSYFSGHLENILICLCTLQMIFIKHDAFMLNMALDIRQKVVLGMISLLVTLFLMYLLVPQYKIIGLCVSLIIGRSILSFGFPLAIGKFLNSSDSKQLPTRVVFVSAVILLTASVLSSGYVVSTWTGLIWQAFVLGCVVIMCIYFIGLDAQMKKALSSRIKGIYIKKQPGNM